MEHALIAENKKLILITLALYAQVPLPIEATFLIFAAAIQT